MSEPYCGFTLHTAVEAAVDHGTEGAWEWLQAWFRADATTPQDEAALAAGPARWDDPTQ